MFMDLWVATDGITPIRFSDKQSALLYCAQTGWAADDLIKVRTQLHVNSEDAVVEPWCNRMDPEVDCENPGTWADNVFVPPATSMKDGSESEDDMPYTLSEEYIGKLAFVTAVTGWEFRDLAASVPEMVQSAFEFATAAIEKSEEVTWQQTMDYVFTKTGKKRIID